MNRRDILKAALWLSTSALLNSCGSVSPELQPTPPPTLATVTALPIIQNGKGGNQAEVIVIGAGAAGLAAAKAIQAEGKKVIVLEARNRLGGRVWSNRIWPDVTLDMGASWIHGIDGNPLTVLAKSYQLKTVPTDADALALHNTDGKLLSDNEMVEIEALFEKVAKQLDTLRQQYEAEDKDDISLQAALDIVLPKMKLSPTELIQLNYAVNATIEHEYAADVAKLSLYYWDADDSDFSGGDVLFPNGYDQIFQNLAAELDVRLEHIVSEITYNDAGVKVTTSQGEFTAEQAVITLPVGVLKKGTVKFSPPLPEAKQTAINHLGMGVLNKVYLRFTEIFWEEEADWLGYISANKGEWSEFVNIAKAVQQPILLCFNAGEYGAKIEAFSDEQIVAAAMQTLRTMYGAQIPDPTAWLITRWISDPFADGSYSYRAVDATSDDHDALAAPVANRLFFAGEATSRDNSATVHGAYLSGLQAAKQLLS
jgi:monoamine oxidase